jgi:ubiquinone/menaquinone biosynthesis C-methylase UbiE
MIDRRTREQAEIDRSRDEARRTPAAQLVADEHEVSRYLDPPRTTAFPLEFAYAQLGDVRGRVVLDLGCGSGQHALVLARRGARTIGVDLSEALIRLARRRLAVNGLSSAARFVIGSAHDLPVVDASVDVVFGINILHHLDLDTASRELHRVLKPGGFAVFQEPVRDSRLVRFVRRCIPYQQAAVSPFERPLTTRELRRFAARFAASAWRPFSLPFVRLAHVVPPLRRHVHAAHALDAAILQRLPKAAPFCATRVLHVCK